MEQRLKNLVKGVEEGKSDIEDNIIKIRDYYIESLISKDWVNLCDAYDYDRIQLVVRKEYKAYPFDDINIRLGIDEEGMWWSVDEEKTQNPIKSVEFLPAMEEIEKAIGITYEGGNDGR